MASPGAVGSSIDTRIVMVRGQRIMLDADLAKLYGVPVKAINQAVRRNADRFPSDFAFRLDWDEAKALRSQIVTLDGASTKRLRRGEHRKYAPYAFTEQGVAMLSSVLKSKRAVLVNVEIMRAFVRLRELVGHSRDLARRVDALEAKYDRQFKVVFDAIRDLMTPTVPAKRRIGFISDD